MTGLALGYLPEIKQVHFVISELIKAKEKHPKFPENPAEALCIISEEFGELAEAINDKQSKERMIEEAAHIAVTAIRFLERLENFK